MGKWMEETLFGLKEIPKSEQDFSSNRMKTASYVMTYDEFFENRKMLNEAHAKAREYDAKIEIMAVNVDRALEKKKEQIEKDLARQNINFLKEVEKNFKEDREKKLYGVINEKKAEIKELKKLNESLLKIHKQKSNAEREVRPKKTHDGYLILSMTEERVGGDPCWKTILQTPYQVSLTPASVVKGIIVDDLRHVLPEMGCHRITEEDVELENSKDRYNGAAVNAVYRHRLKANGISGFYEISLWTMCPLRISEDRVPGQGRSNKEERKE